MTIAERPATVARPAQKAVVRLSLPRSVGVVLLAFWLAAFMIGCVWFVFADSGFWIASGAAACLILTLPLVLKRKYDVISAWSLVVVAGYMGYGVRGLFIALRVDGLRSIDELYLLGQPVSAFYRPTLVVLLGLTLFMVGYLLGGTRKAGALPPSLIRGRFRDHRVTGVVAFAAALGAVGFLLYAQSTGGLSLANFSEKRTLISGVELQTSYQSFGQFRVLNTFSALAFWIQLAHYASRGMRHRLFSARGAWLALLGLNAAVLPIYASTRADVAYLVVGALVIEFCLNPRRVKARSAVLAATASVLIILAMSSLRSNADGEQGVTIDSSTFVDAFVLTRTFPDIPTSANIINAVPGKLEYDGGQSILAWAVAPVPRAVWPSKPLISSGPILGAAIYGNTRSGVPPGMIAESYWDFGLVGILLLPLLCGIAIRWLETRWSPWASRSPAAAVLLAVVTVRPGIDIMTNSIGFGPFQVLQSLVLLVPLLWILRDPGDPSILRSPVLASR